jgi:DnaD N-terminal domain
MKKTATPPEADNVISLPVTKAERRRAADKWTAPVVNLGYTQLPSLILKAQAKLKLTPVQLNVLLHIIEPWWDADRLPWIAKDSIAQRMRKTPRSIQRVITQLEKAGHIRRVQRFYGHRQQTANAYALDGLVKKLAALEPEFRKAKEQNRLRRKKVEAA